MGQGQGFQPTPSNTDLAGQFFQLTQFGGMNTLVPRFALADGEFSYLENLLPVVAATVNPTQGTAEYSSALLAVPGQGPNLPGLPAGQTIDRMWQRSWAQDRASPRPIG